MLLSIVDEAVCIRLQLVSTVVKLTKSIDCGNAPWASRALITLPWPWRHAMCSAVTPYWIFDVEMAS